MSAYPQDFRKILGRWDSVAIIIAIVIGVGIFRVPAEVAKYLNSPNLIVLAWLSGGLISLQEPFVMLNFPHLFQKQEGITFIFEKAMVFASVFFLAGRSY